MKENDLKVQLWLGVKDKKPKLDYPDKRYIQKPKSVLENETSGFLWDFKTKTNYLMPVRIYR